jgi:hypothetical protein
MSTVSIRAALESALAAMTPALDTAFENASFLPPAASTPYQQVNVMFAEPRNPVFGDAMHRESGIMQVKLLYPLQAGTKDAATRAELLRSTFYRGASFTKSGVTVVISETPEVAAGGAEGGMWSVPVKIRFYANIN